MMKASLLFLLLIVLGAPAHALSDDEAERIMTAMDIDGLLASQVEELTRSVTGNDIAWPDQETKARVRDRIARAVADAGFQRTVREAVKRSYAKRFTSDDVETLEAFLKSPTGRRYFALSLGEFAAIQKQLRSDVQGLAPVIDNIFNEELKRGIREEEKPALFNIAYLGKKPTSDSPIIEPGVGVMPKNLFLAFGRDGTCAGGFLDYPATVTLGIAEKTLDPRLKTWRKDTKTDGDGALVELHYRDDSGFGIRCTRVDGGMLHMDLGRE